MLVSSTDSVFRQEFVARKNWQFFESALAIFFNRKARIRWLSCGDANTKFFYKAVLAHQLRNSIRFLKDADGNLVFNQSQIREMAVTYFRSILSTEDSLNILRSVKELRAMLAYRCPPAIGDQISKLPTEEEIKGVLFGMPKNKAPGPDGFAAEFFWEAWEMVGSDTLRAVREFFESGRMLKQFNATAIL